MQGRGMGGGGKCVWASIYWGWKGFGRGERKSAAEKVFCYFNILGLKSDKKKCYNMSLKGGLGLFGAGAVESEVQ